MARSLIEDQAYQALFKARLHAGTIPPGVESMLWHYAYGKPAEHLKFAGEDGGPVLVKFVGIEA
jgi:hypothetical protein